MKTLVTQCLTLFGRVDIGVNCAGASIPKPILEIDESEWDQNLALNLKGLFSSNEARSQGYASSGAGGRYY